MHPVNHAPCLSRRGSKVSRLLNAAELFPKRTSGLTRHIDEFIEKVLIAGLHKATLRLRSRLGSAAEEILKDGPEGVERTIEVSSAAGIGAKAIMDFSE